MTMVYPVPVLRGHNPRSNRGSFHGYWEQGSYDSAGYHDYHDNPCHDYQDHPAHNYPDNSGHDYPDNSFHARDYDERQFQEHRCHDEERGYHDYRESGHKRGRNVKWNYYNVGYKSRGRGDAAAYNIRQSEPYCKKIKNAKIDKTPKREDDRAGLTKPSTIPPLFAVVHNPARSVVILTSGDSSTAECKKTTDPAAMSIKEQEGGKPRLAILAEPSVKESKDVKFEEPSSEKVTTNPVSNIKTEPQEENIPPVETAKTKETSLQITAGKRPYPENGEPYMTHEKIEEETCTAKRVHNESAPEGYSKENAPSIPMLDGWIEESHFTPCTSEKDPANPESEQSVSNHAKVLRTAFILAKKEEIELAYAQDCRTFALVANTLLKKDPAIEAAVASALRSSLQEIAGRCVHELSSFIERYDIESNVLIDSANIGHTDN
ncbi:uncharacterized protein RCH25_041551 [Pelodytes ibericus]